jgi:hypothetical protein
MCCIRFQKNGRASIFYIEDIHKNPQNAAKIYARYLNEQHNSFHIIFAGLTESVFGNFLKIVSEALDKRQVANIVGGISSGFNKNGEILTYQFADGKIIKNGLLVVSFENVKAAIEVSLGFKPYGAIYKIEKSDGYNIYSIDDGESFVQIAKHLLNGIEYPEIRYLWYAPLYMISETDGQVATLRTIAAIEDDCVRLYGPVKKGEHFKLSFATPEDLLEEDVNAAIRMKNRIDNPELAFNFSCVARQYALEEKQAEEPMLYFELLNTHVFGFFTYGEIGSDKKFENLKLYNETSLLVAMREQ